MRNSLFAVLTICIGALAACDYSPNRSNIIVASRSYIDTARRYIVVQRDTTKQVDTAHKDSSAIAKTDTVVTPAKPAITQTDTIKKAPAPINASAAALINYAKTLIGKPYVYGANTPEKGFDNSGFVHHVFEHAGIKVPKYAPAYISAGDNVSLADAQAGDIILFAKSDTLKKAVYQVGIVVTPKGEPLQFIHASGGKLNGVGIATLSNYYKGRLMGFRRVGLK